MPTKARREDTLVERFLSAYEDRSWATAEIEWLDNKVDKAVEARATRRPDGKTLAIEHTIIEPFVHDKEDFAFFNKAFLAIEQDTGLAVPNRWVSVFVPVGTLHGQHKRTMREAIVEAVHRWIRDNRLSLPEGDSTHPCTVNSPGSSTYQVLLTVRVVRLPGSAKLHVRRQQTKDTLGVVVEKALRNKIAKLVQTQAEKRILCLSGNT